MNAKRCSSCKETKPLGEFHRSKNAKDGHHNQCKLCKIKTDKEWLKKNPQKRKATAKKYRQSNPGKVKAINKEWAQENRNKINATSKRWRLRNPNNAANGWLMRQYGITLDQYNEMLTAQEGNCAMCGKALEKRKRRHPIDHDHSKEGPESIRGIVHHQCNVILGMCDDNIDTLRAAIEYLGCWSDIDDIEDV